MLTAENFRTYQRALTLFAGLCSDEQFAALIADLQRSRELAADDIQLRAIVAEQRVPPTWSADSGQKVSVAGAMPVVPGVSLDIGTRWQHERDQQWEARQSQREAAQGTKS